VNLVNIDNRECIVELLKIVSDAAEAGNIRSIVVTCVTIDGAITGNYAFSPNASPFELLGAMHTTMENISEKMTDGRCTLG